MRLGISSLKLQLAGLGLLLLGPGLYCLVAGDCALLTPDQQGYRHYLQQRYQEAAQRFTNPMWRGVALFRQGDFEQAAALFAGYDTPEAAFNQGNALVMRGQYITAVERFERALQRRPDWEAAINNRDIALARAARLKQDGGDMTGGKIGADDIVFTKAKPPPTSGEEAVEGGQEPAQPNERAIWLRQVQTRPADFLRVKFAYQYATRNERSDRP
jgi:Ca-activated chloride channel family protein